MQPPAPPKFTNINPNEIPAPTPMQPRKKNTGLVWIIICLIIVVLSIFSTVAYFLVIKPYQQEMERQKYEEEQWRQEQLELLDEQEQQAQQQIDEIDRQLRELK